MKKISIFFIVLLLIFMVTGCDEGIQTEITEITETSIFIPDDYSNVLIRPWLFSEICESVYFDGHYISFPFSVNSLNSTLKENNTEYSLNVDYFTTTYATGIITTPTLSEIHVTWAGSNETPLNFESLVNTPIMSMTIFLGYEPIDFSLNDMKLGVSVDTTYSDFGVPDFVNEYNQNEANIIELYYYGIDSQSIILKFSNNILSEMFLSR